MSSTNRPRRVAIRFAVQGDLRFISHRDTVRLLERALVRAGIPVRYSSGFNPRARVWVPLPRPVGVAARDELMILELSEAIAPERVLDALRSQMPEGLVLRAAERVETRSMPRAVAAEYRLPVTNGTCQPLSERAAALAALDHMEIERGDPSSAATRIIDIRPFIESLEVVDSELAIRVRVTQDGSVRPRELLDVLGLAPDDYLHRMQRIAVTWDWPARASAEQDETDEGAAP